MTCHRVFYLCISLDCLGGHLILVAYFPIVLVAYFRIVLVVYVFVSILLLLRVRKMLTELVRDAVVHLIVFSVRALNLLKVPCNCGILVFLSAA